MKNLIESIERRRVSIVEWMMVFAGIVFVRLFLEALSSPTLSGVIRSDAPTIIHYCLYYIVAIIGLMHLLRFFTKKESSIVSVSLTLFLLLWVAPVIDLILSLGNGYVQSYYFTGVRQMLSNFLTFFGSAEWFRGSTPGMRIGLALAIGSTGWYVWHSTGSKMKSILSMVSMYAIIFLMGSFPSILYIISHLSSSWTASNGDIYEFLNRSVMSSSLVHNTLHATLQFSTFNRFFEIVFDKLMSQIWFIIGFLLTVAWFWKVYPKKFKAVISNSRWGPVTHYSLLVIVGATFAFLGGYGKLVSWIDALSFFILLVSWYAVWMFSVHLNDLSDTDTDAVSNPDRPLSGGIMTAEEMKQTAVVWLAVALLGSFSVGYYQFYLCLSYAAFGYVYSAPFLRLKRVTVLSSFILGMASLSSVLAGFFFVSFDKDLTVFPPLAALGIIAMFTLITNVRDIEDAEGDAAAGIKTLPVIFGIEKGRRVVGAMAAAGFLIVPLFTRFTPLIFTAVPAALGAYYVIAHGKREKTFFIIYFCFIIASGLFVILY